MRKIILLLLLPVSIHTFAQKFPFPKDANTDSVTLNRNMNALARQMIPLYTNADKKTYFDNIFRYQIVAQKYTDALSNLDSIRNLLKAADSNASKVIGFGFETYAAARIRQLQREIPFEEAYPVSFGRLYNALPPSAAATASSYFTVDVASIHEKFTSLLNEQLAKDSIDMEDAQALVRLYNSYIVYSRTIPLATPLLAEQDTRQFLIEDSVLIKTRDGSIIAATVVRKKDAPAKQPAIFVFNIYTGGVDKSTAKQSAINGYVGIVANTRGKRLSPQDIEPFEHDANDAYDIIDWISKQPWSNGKVGMFGGSYLGFSQWAAAKKVHPALKTIIPQVAVGIGIDYPMQNNVFMSYMLQWIHYVTNSKKTDEADFGNYSNWGRTNRAYYSSGKAFRSLDSIEGRPSKIFQRWLQHPSHDAYWQNMVAYKEDFSKINIPILTTTGYFDADQLGAMYYYKQHHLYNKNANHYLVIGPYDHGGAQSIPSAQYAGYKIDSVANMSITKLAYKWFDYILKDSTKPAILKDNVNYQVMGTNQWKHVAALSKMNNDTINFYLSNIRTSEHYKLASKPESAEFIRQEVNFADRTDTTHIGSGNIEDSVLDVSNSISFISAPFEKAFDINGSFTGTLQASINKKDMDVSISLYELQPNGKYFSLNNYLGRASFAKDRSKRQLLQPNKIETIPIDNSFFTSKKIAAGSRLVIVLGINKTPFWQINYGTGKDVSDETISDAKVPLEIKWYSNSVIKIPVFKY